MKRKSLKYKKYIFIIIALILCLRLNSFVTHQTIQKTNNLTIGTGIGEYSEDYAYYAIMARSVDKRKDLKQENYRFLSQPDVVRRIEFLSPTLKSSTQKIFMNLAGREHGIVSNDQIMFAISSQEARSRHYPSTEVQAMRVGSGIFYSVGDQVATFIYAGGNPPIENFIGDYESRPVVFLSPSNYYIKLADGSRNIR